MIRIANLRAFRKYNHLTQMDIANFFGTSKAFITQIETGRVSLPYDKELMLVNNDKGWEVPVEAQERTAVDALIEPMDTRTQIAMRMLPVTSQIRISTPGNNAETLIPKESAIKLAVEYADGLIEYLNKDKQ